MANDQRAEEISKRYNIREWEIDNLPPSFTVFAVGAPGSGKSTLMTNIAYFNKHKYPIARIFTNNEKGYLEYCSIFHPLYVSNYYDEEEEKRYVLRQKTCTLENTIYEERSAVNIIDDPQDPKIYRTPLVRNLFKVGSQHYNNACLVGSQYSVDLPPEIRKSVSYVALFKEADDIELQKLYRNFGGVVGDFQTFKKLLQGITGDHTCMVISRREASNDLQDCVYWCKTRKLGPWSFGSAEYKSWAKQRYNPAYVDKAMV